MLALWLRGVNVLSSDRGHMGTSKLELWQKRVALRLDALGFTITDIGKITKASVTRLRRYLAATNPDQELLQWRMAACLLVRATCPHCAATVVVLKTMAAARCDTCYHLFDMVHYTPEAKAPPSAPKASSVAPVISARKARARQALARPSRRAAQDHERFAKRFGDDDEPPPLPDEVA